MLAPLFANGNATRVSAPPVQLTVGWGDRLHAAPVQPPMHVQLPARPVGCDWQDPWPLHGTFHGDTVGHSAVRVRP